MRYGFRVELFGRPLAPIRDNIDEAQQDAVRLKMGDFDEDGRFYLDVGVELQPRPIRTAKAA
ncbi:hypothetical protein HNO88_000282 [Novosphingobium chloroacetimidivorans]|uniref:Uncharacterized protein n=1 Tax=Novosphingobium chloroacetimidivorans TaxID=1428314 RepID=A0A7W7NVC4_9SPHN|nr:hypothetical protein [Novosphingobium chloroacetimidivorans]